MTLRFCLICLLCCLVAAPAAGQPQSTELPALGPARLYQQVAGGIEDHLVKRGETLTFLALKKGVQWQVLARLNDLKKPYRIKAGMVLKINNTHIVPSELGDGLVINLPELMLYHFQQGSYQRRYALAVGKRSWPTPTGDYQIVNKARNPTWVVPASIQEEMAEQGKEVLEKVAPGPKNPLGSYWMGTSAPGVGIHATNRPWSVGYSVSHGCIRMLPGEIAELYPQVPLGTPVKILYQPIKLARTAQGRILLEAHPNIYRQKLDSLAYVQELARRYRLEHRIDWGKVPEILKAREGIAQDITKVKAPGFSTRAAAPEPSKSQPAPLQDRQSKLE
jgi:L,D-transpeptidase ErfK/SrfK